MVAATVTCWHGKNKLAVRCWLPTAGCYEFLALVRPRRMSGVEAPAQLHRHKSGVYAPTDPLIHHGQDGRLSAGRASSRRRRESRTSIRRPHCKPPTRCRFGPNAGVEARRVVSFFFGPCTPAVCASPRVPGRPHFPTGACASLARAVLARHQLACAFPPPWSHWRAPPSTGGAVLHSEGRATTGTFAARAR